MDSMSTNRNDKILNDWIKLIEKAVKDKEDIRVNHRYTYNNKKLGTFLVGVKKKKDLLVIERIRNAGFEINKNSRDPEHFATRFASQLLSDTKKSKTSFQTIFNKSILPRKDKLNEETIELININWFKKFEEERVWEKPLNTLDKIILWKEYRYNKEINIDNKWHLSVKQVGNLYYWIRNFYIGKHDINTISGVFNEKEKRELESEGFPIKRTKK